MNPTLDRALTAAATIGGYAGLALFALLALVAITLGQFAAIVATPFFRTPRHPPARERAGRRQPSQAAARLRMTGAR